jgi:hypothetical protein
MGNPDFVIFAADYPVEVFDKMLYIGFGGIKHFLTDTAGIKDRFGNYRRLAHGFYRRRNRFRGDRRPGPTGYRKNQGKKYTNYWPFHDPILSNY